MRDQLIARRGVDGSPAASVAVRTGAQQARRDAPTFSKDVAPILYKHCVSCHRPGEIGRDVAADVRTGATVCEGDCECRDESHDAAVARRGARRHISQRAIAHRSRASDADGVGRGRCGQRRSEGLAGAAGVQRGMVARQAGRRARNAGGLPHSGNRHHPVRMVLHSDELRRSEMGEVARDQAGRSRRRSPCARLLSRKA